MLELNESLSSSSWYLDRFDSIYNTINLAIAEVSTGIRISITIFGIFLCKLGSFKMLVSFEEDRRKYFVEYRGMVYVSA